MYSKGRAVNINQTKVESDRSSQTNSIHRNPSSLNNSSYGSILQLQQTIGNQAVQHMFVGTSASSNKIQLQRKSSQDYESYDDLDAEFEEEEDLDIDDDAREYLLEDGERSPHNLGGYLDRAFAESGIIREGRSDEHEEDEYEIEEQEQDAEEPEAEEQENQDEALKLAEARRLAEEKLKNQNEIKDLMSKRDIVSDKVISMMDLAKELSNKSTNLSVEKFEQIRLMLKDDVTNGKMNDPGTINATIQSIDQWASQCLLQLQKIGDKTAIQTFGRTYENNKQLYFEIRVPFTDLTQSLFSSLLVDTNKFEQALATLQNTTPFKPRVVPPKPKTPEEIRTEGISAIKNRLGIIWNLNQEDALLEAEGIYTSDPKALDGLKDSSVTKLTYNRLKLILGNANELRDAIIMLKTEEELAELYRRLQLDEPKTGDHVIALLNEGLGRLAGANSFDYQGDIEVEIYVKWDKWMPFSRDWGVIHIHYNGVLPTRASMQRAHTKRFENKGVGMATEQIVTGYAALMDKCYTYIDPLNLTKPT